MAIWESAAGTNIDCLVVTKGVTVGDQAHEFGVIKELSLKARYAVAAVARVHMEVDYEGLLDLPALSEVADEVTQAEANTRANALRTALAAHMAGVGTPFVDGEHLAADTTLRTTLLAIPAASTLNTCITLVNGINTASVAHGNSSGVHFHDDAAEVSATITTVPPTTLARCIKDLNDLRQTLLNHFSLGSL